MSASTRPTRQPVVLGAIKTAQSAKKGLQSPNLGKYGARSVTVDGVRFASQWEAERFGVLRTREKAGEIADLEPHPAFLLVVNGVKIGRYTADARYRVVASGEIVVEDCKSKPTKTEAYGLRKRLMVACHGIGIQEVERR